MSYDDDPTEIIWTSPARHEQEPRRALGVRAPAAVAGLATAAVIGSVIGLALAGAEPTSLDLPPDAPTLTAPALPAPAGTTPARRSPARPTTRPTPRTVPTVTVHATSPTTSASVPVVATPRPSAIPGAFCPAVLASVQALSGGAPYLCRADEAGRLRWLPMTNQSSSPSSPSSTPPTDTPSLSPPSSTTPTDSPSVVEES